MTATDISELLTHQLHVHSDAPPATLSVQVAASLSAHRGLLDLTQIPGHPTPAAAHMAATLAGVLADFALVPLSANRDPYGIGGLLDRLGLRAGPFLPDPDAGVTRVNGIYSVNVRHSLPRHPDLDHGTLHGWWLIVRAEDEVLDEVASTGLYGI